MNVQFLEFSGEFEDFLLGCSECHLELLDAVRVGGVVFMRGVQRGTSSPFLGVSKKVSFSTRRFSMN